MTEIDAVNAWNSLVFVVFWLLLLVGTGSTLARIAYYKANGFRRPRLLIRDGFMVGGFSLSFGMFLFARVARAAGADVGFLSTSLVWAVVTSLPAITAVLVYAYFEVFVIERGADIVRDEAYQIPPPEDT